MNLFDPNHTARPDRALFFTRNDANDPRLGEIVRSELAAYESAQVVILGCPQDEGVRRNGGRVGAARGPQEIRRFLYRLTTNGLAGLQLFDVGDTVVQDSLEATHNLQRAVVRQVIADGKGLVVLGGGNDIAYPDCAGLADAVGPVLACNLDAHLDVRADTPRNSGTPYRQLLDEGLLRPELFYEVGGQPFANSPVYLRELAERGAHVLLLPEVRRRGLEAILAEMLAAAPADCAIFWGFDLDAVAAADAPGVSAPNPTGISGGELCAAAALAGADPRSRLLELSEVNPAYDLDGRTARLAAAAAWSFLVAWSG